MSTDFDFGKGAHDNTVDYSDERASYHDSSEHDTVIDNSEHDSWNDDSTYSSHDGDITSYEGDVDDSFNTTEINHTDDNDVVDLKDAVSLDLL